MGRFRPPIPLTAWVAVLGISAAALFLGSLDTIGLAPPAEAPEGSVRAPYCEEAGSGLIVAQSVPAASMVPCLGALPAGWNVSTTSVNQQRSIVHFDSDRAGANAAVLHFAGTCDHTGAVPVPNDEAQIARYERLDRPGNGYKASWYAVVDGGCWWWDFDFAPGTPSATATELDAALRARSRSDINAVLADTFIDQPL